MKALGAVWVALLVALGASASAETLRIGTSGDYAPFSVVAEDGSFSGLDVEMARAYAAARGLEIEWVRFAWPELAADLAAGRFDAAWSGVTVRPDRSVAGTFTVPTLRSGAVLLVPEGAESPEAAAYDRQGARIAVNRGGHLERVARKNFPKAEILAVPDNAAVPARLAAGEADAVVSDTLEAPHWVSRSAVPLRVLGPFTADWKAVWVRKENTALARDLDAWLVEAEADGTLGRLREAAGVDPAPTATPAVALQAAQDERLALMPGVAEAKRRSGSPIEVPEREARVIEAGIARAHEAAKALGLPTPDDERVAAFYRAQIEAAKAVQRDVLAGPPSAEPPPDLDAAVRPALLRIGDRIAWLLVQRRAPGP